MHICNKNNNKYGSKKSHKDVIQIPNRNICENIILRLYPMLDEHIETIMHIEKECFSDPWTYGMLKQQVNDPFGIQRVAIMQQVAHGAVLCGYICGIVVSDECTIYRVACQREFRKKGVATALIHDFINKAIQRGAQRCYLEVDASNNIAQYLYHRYGFTCVGRRHRYYRETGEDALILYKTLDHVDAIFQNSDNRIRRQ